MLASPAGGDVVHVRDLRAGQMVRFETLRGTRTIRVTRVEELDGTVLVRVHRHAGAHVGGMTCASDMPVELVEDGDWDCSARLDQRCPRCRGEINSDSDSFFCAQPTLSPWGGRGTVEHGRGCGWGITRETASKSCDAQARWLLTLGRDASFDGKQVIFEMARSRPPATNSVRLGGNRGPSGRVLDVRESRPLVLTPCVVTAEFEPDKVCDYAEKIIWEGTCPKSA